MYIIIDWIYFVSIPIAQYCVSDNERIAKEEIASNVPEVPQLPEVAITSDISKVPLNPEELQVPEKPSVPEIPKDFITANAAKVLEASQLPEFTRVPIEPLVPEVPKVPIEPLVPEVAQVPEAPEVPAKSLLAHLSEKTLTLLHEYREYPILLEHCAKTIFCETKPFLPDLSAFSFVAALETDCNLNSAQCSLLQ